MSRKTYWMVKADPYFKNCLKGYKDFFSSIGEPLSNRELTRIVPDLFRWDDLRKAPKKEVNFMIRKAKGRGLF